MPKFGKGRRSLPVLLSRPGSRSPIRSGLCGSKPSPLPATHKEFHASPHGRAMSHLQYLCPRWKENKAAVETAAEKDRAERMPPLVEEPAEDNEPDEIKDQTKERTGEGRTKGHSIKSAQKADQLRRMSQDEKRKEAGRIVQRNALIVRNQDQPIAKQAGGMTAAEDRKDRREAGNARNNATAPRSGGILEQQDEAIVRLKRKTPV